MADCCQDKACELAQLRGRQRRVLWAALAINAGMFGVELVIGLLAGSTALLADSLDMLGDALVYGFSLFVVARSLRWQAGAALLKGGVMSAFGLAVLGQAAYRLLVPETPDYPLMLVTGFLALAANGACLWLLTRHRSDNLNMRSVWLCSRNDIIANIGVLAAAGGVAFTNTQWADLAVGAAIAALFLRTALQVTQEALRQWAAPPRAQPAHNHTPATAPLRLVLPANKK